MTDIEQKALALAVEAAGRRMQDYNIMAEENVLRQSIEAHARAIERHEAFRQEVSDALEKRGFYIDDRDLGRFITAKPDPLVDAVAECDDGTWETKSEYAEKLRAAIEKRGGKIVWGEG
jgi:hypothetical protein